MCVLVQVKYQNSTCTTRSESHVALRNVLLKKVEHLMHSLSAIDFNIEWFHPFHPDYCRGLFCIRAVTYRDHLLISVLVLRDL